MTYRHAAFKPLAAILTAALISGCATAPEGERAYGGPRQGDSGQLQVSCSTNATPEHRVELDAIDAMMSRSEYYAALARLEAMPFQTQHHWLRWAQLLAQVEQLPHSEEAYRQIAQSCDSARAYHGLGVVYLKQGKLQESLEALQTAKIKDPASADVRNDFGVALMKAGTWGQAVFELRTAYELSGRSDGTARNMIAAYYLHGGEQSAARVQRELGLSDQLMAAGKQFSSRFAGGSR